MLNWIFALGWFVAVVLFIRGTKRKEFDIVFIGDEYFVLEVNYWLNISISYSRHGKNGDDLIGWETFQEAKRAQKRLKKGKSIWNKDN
jgi:hypothetical protein